MKPPLPISASVLMALSVLIAPAAARGQMASHAPTSMANTTVASASAPQMAPALQVSDKAVARVNGAVLTDRDLLREMYSIFPYAQQHNGFPKGRSR